MNLVSTSVYGVVRDESGKPLSGVAVYIVAGTGSWRDIAAITNEKGEYKLSGMNPGSYVLSASHGEFNSANVNIGIGEGPSRLDIALKRK